MGKCKTKAIQTDLDTFRHSQSYPGNVQTYSKHFVTLAHSEPLYIKNPGILRTKSIFRTLAYFQPGIFRTPVYSERCHIENLRHIQNPV